MSLSASPTVCRSRVSRTSSSPSSRSASQRFSSSGSHLACSGPSSIHSSTNTLATIAGIASIRNSHCQSSRPADAAEHGHDPAGDRRADGVGDRDRRHEEPDRARPLPRREPVRQVQDHAREEARLGGAEQEAHDVEARRPLHERGAGGDDPPGEHDPRDPLARAELVQREVARDLEEEVRDEEDARAEAVDRAGEAEVGLELVLGERDVHPVEVGDDVEDQERRHQPRGDPLHRPRLQLRCLLPQRHPV